MKSDFFISPSAWTNIVNSLDKQDYIDKTGSRCDLNLFQEHSWLKDSAVVEQLIPHKGAWTVYLVFAHHQNPFKFIRKPITTYTCLRKAQLMSSCLRRNAAKDARGTLQVDANLLNESIN